MRIKECLSYDDVLLVPKYSDIVSRSEVDTSACLSPDLIFELPIISSPMDTVTAEEMVAAMGSVGGLGIIHRYNTIDDQCGMVTRAKFRNSAAPVAAAIGISGDYQERAYELTRAGASILCLDVAHGHHILMKDALTSIKSMFNSSIHIMAGNVATKSGFEDLARWGADSVRCNIGGGSICSTRIQTGHGVPGLQTLFDCFDSAIERDVKIIADGGIRNSGDMVKALAAGADFVMVGSLLSGTEETPGPVIRGKDGRSFKTYRGMASPEAQVRWRGKASSLEGVSTMVLYRGSVVPIIEELAVGIRSGLSYSGSRNILELQSKAEFIKQTSSGIVESGTHINRRFNG